jgi:hypothetical protein
MKLLGRNIFKVGTWNDMKFTEQDLDDIVDNFAKLKDVHQVPLKFGHDADHKDGQPAIGWITDVYRKGKDLFADFDNVPSIVMDAITAKRFRTVSVEVIRNAKLNGDEIKTWFLDAVALLGADQPAVSGLTDLADLTLTRTAFADGERIVFGKVGNFGSLNKDTSMDKAELKSVIDSALAPLQSSIDELKAENKELQEKVTKSESDNSDLQTQLDEKNEAESAEKVDASRKAANDILDAAVRQKSIVPAQRDGIVAMFGIKDDKRVGDIDLDQLKATVGYKEDKQNGKSKTFSRDGEDDDLSSESLDQQVVLATRKVQASNPKLDYASAQQLALSADPKLAQKYADSNGVFNSDGGVDR